MNDIRTVVPVNGRNPNNHLWNNNGTWWVHYTEHLPDWTKRRVRRSLGTRDVTEARRRRDAILRQSTLPTEGMAVDVSAATIAARKRRRPRTGSDLRWLDSGCLMVPL